MAERSSVDGRYWFPLGTRTHYGKPEPGQLLAFDHQVWQVVEVSRHLTDTERPLRVRLRPARLADHPDPVMAASGDQHFAAATGMGWHVYPDPEHYPVCACCGEPMPCRDEVGRKMAAAAVEQMGRHETAGMCPACEEPVTRRQRSITFDDNLYVPGGPPVAFHLRGRCWQSAYEYEQRWAAADPNRRCTLSCHGHLTNHNDGTYECTSAAVCPGPTAYHVSMSVCSCSSCHGEPWTWGQGGCHPDPKARLREDRRHG